MHTAHLGRVIVEKRNNSIFERSIDLDLLLDLPFDTGAIGLLIHGKERFVGLVHVTADPD